MPPTRTVTPPLDVYILGDPTRKKVPDNLSARSFREVVSGKALATPLPPPPTVLPWNPSGYGNDEDDVKRESWVFSGGGVWGERILKGIVSGSHNVVPWVSFRLRRNCVRFFILSIEGRVGFRGGLQWAHKSVTVTVDSNDIIFRLFEIMIPFFGDYSNI